MGNGQMAEEMGPRIREDNGRGDNGGGGSGQKAWAMSRPVR